MMDERLRQARAGPLPDRPGLSQFSRNAKRLYLSNQEPSSPQRASRTF